MAQEKKLALMASHSPKAEAEAEVPTDAAALEAKAVFKIASF